MMSEPERRNTWREILGIAETKNEETRRDRSRRRAVFILTVAFIVFLLLGISSGVWLWVADVDYLVAHPVFTDVVCGIVAVSDFALWAISFASAYLAFSRTSPEDVQDRAEYVATFSFIFALVGLFSAPWALSLPPQLWVGVHHPFSPGGVDVRPVASSTGNATGLYLATLSINVNGIPPKTTLVVTNATFYNPFSPVKCVLYQTNVGNSSFPLIITVESTTQGPNIDPIQLTFLCNNVPIKSVLVTNYGNFTYSYPS
jgi:hypothetical protein